MDQSNLSHPTHAPDTLHGRKALTPLQSFYVELRVYHNELVRKIYQYQPEAMWYFAVDSVASQTSLIHPKYFNSLITFEHALSCQAHLRSIDAIISMGLSEKQQLEAFSDPCYNCGVWRHWAQYCPEPRRSIPAGAKQHNARVSPVSPFSLTLPLRQAATSSRAPDGFRQAVTINSSSKRGQQRRMPPNGIPPSSVQPTPNRSFLGAAVDPAASSAQAKASANSKHKTQDARQVKSHIKDNQQESIILENGENFYDIDDDNAEYDWDLDPLGFKKFQLTEDGSLDVKAVLEKKEEFERDPYGRLIAWPPVDAIIDAYMRRCLKSAGLKPRVIREVYTSCRIALQLREYNKMMDERRAEQKISDQISQSPMKSAQRSASDGEILLREPTKVQDTSLTMSDVANSPVRVEARYATRPSIQEHDEKPDDRSSKASEIDEPTPTPPVPRQNNKRSSDEMDSDGTQGSKRQRLEEKDIQSEQGPLSSSKKRRNRRIRHNRRLGSSQG